MSYQGFKIVNLSESNPLNQCAQLLPNIDALVLGQELCNLFFPNISQLIVPQRIQKERKYITSVQTSFTALTQRQGLHEVKEIIARLNDNWLVIERR